MIDNVNITAYVYLTYLTHSKDFYVVKIRTIFR